jgi:ABC-type nitrate/sulfonate/bicarbonate transport system ATPase subunit
MGDRIVILCARPARIVDIFENPLKPAQRDVDHPQFIQFKKNLLHTVLQLMETEVLS